MLFSLYTATHNGEPFPNLLVQLLYRDKTSEMQILAAKVLAYMCRGGAIDPQDPKIAMKVNILYFVELLTHKILK
jgi:hypothetical protein